MRKSVYWAAGALIAGLTLAGGASASPLPHSGASNLTQDLSARCRVVVSTAWRHGRRVTVRRTVCTPSCRTVVTHRWHNGHRVTVRRRVC
jgi:hypothetical protein